MALGQKGFGHSIGLGGFSDWVAPRRNAMLGLASGLLASPDFSTGLSTGFARAADGRQADDAWATAQKAEAERMRQIEEADALKAKYADFFTQQGRADIAQGIADGVLDPGEQYMRFIQPKDAAKPMEINGQLVDPATGKVLGDYRTAGGANPRAGVGQPVSLRNKTTGEWAPFAPMSDGTLINTFTGQPANDAEWEYDPAAVAGARAEQTTIGRGQGERTLQAPVVEANMQRLDASTDNVIKTIDKATGQAGWGETGLIGQIAGGIAGTTAFDLRETVKTIKANLGFAELQAMRDASPTGGALGQVAVQELEALQSTLASLNPDQSDEQLKENLQTVKELLERQKSYRRMAAEAKYGQGVTQATGNTTSSGVTWKVK